jgi:hypothetical protein
VSPISSKAIKSMDPEYIKTVIVIIVIVALLYLCVTYSTIDQENGKIEDLTLYNPSRSCANCGDLGKAQCRDCANCGYCYSGNGIGQCVPGNEDGPLFRSDCAIYNYNEPDVQGPDPYWRNGYWWYNGKQYDHRDGYKYYHDHEKHRPRVEHRPRV